MEEAKNLNSQLSLDLEDDEDVLFFDDTLEVSDDSESKLLKKKQKKEVEFFVEYDRLTGTIIEITPEEKLKTETVRHGIFTTKQLDIIDKIFNGKVSLSKIYVRSDKDGGKEIAIGSETHPNLSEFDYKFATYDSAAGAIHIHCDCVMKKITISVDYEKMKQFLSIDDLNESRLEKSNGHFNIFSIDSKDRTKLHDKITINLFELCNSQQIEKRCSWLPDDPAQLKNISFVYWNNELPITYSSSPAQENYRLTLRYQKPQIIYKQQGSTLFLQSVMKDSNNFKINEEIVFYAFSKYDPSRLLETKKVNKTNLNNFNLYKIKLITDQPVRLTTDHLHIHLEESNVSTYYRF